MLTAELMQRQQGVVEVVEGNQAAAPFVFSPQMVGDLELMEFARRVRGVAPRWRPGRAALPSPRRGRPPTYRDESVRVTLLVKGVWQVSPETLVKRMQRWPELAQTGGYRRGG